MRVTLNPAWRPLRVCPAEPLSEASSPLSSADRLLTPPLPTTPTDASYGYRRVKWRSVVTAWVPPRLDT